MNKTTQLKSQETWSVVFVSFCFNIVDMKYFSPCKEQMKGTK